MNINLVQWNCTGTRYVPSIVIAFLCLGRSRGWAILARKRQLPRWICGRRLMLQEALSCRMAARRQREGKERGWDGFFDGFLLLLLLGLGLWLWLLWWWLLLLQ